MRSSLGIGVQSRASSVRYKPAHRRFTYRSLRTWLCCQGTDKEWPTWWVTTEKWHRQRTSSRAHAGRMVHAGRGVRPAHLALVCGVAAGVWAVDRVGVPLEHPGPILLVPLAYVAVVAGAGAGLVAGLPLLAYYAYHIMRAGEPDTLRSLVLFARLRRRDCADRRPRRKAPPADRPACGGRGSRPSLRRDRHPVGAERGAEPGRARFPARPRRGHRRRRANPRHQRELAPVPGGERRRRRRLRRRQQLPRRLPLRRRRRRRPGRQGRRRHRIGPERRARPVHARIPVSRPRPAAVVPAVRHAALRPGQRRGRRGRW